MPADANPAGDIFGGWLMSQRDLAAGNLAGRISKGRAATVAVEAMKFRKPVKVGDEVTLYATLVSAGWTSARRLICLFRRSIGLVLCNLVRCRRGKDMQASTSCSLASIRSAIRDPKSQADGPNIIYEVSERPAWLFTERSFRPGFTLSKKGR